MVGWHHQLNEHEYEQALGDGEGQESVTCCSPWGHKQIDSATMVEQISCVPESITTLLIGYTTK